MVVVVICCGDNTNSIISISSSSHSVVEFLTFKAAVSSSSCFVALDVGCLYRVTLGGMAIPLVVVE